MTASPSSTAYRAGQTHHLGLGAIPQDAGEPRFISGQGMIEARPNLSARVTQRECAPGSTHLHGGTNPLGQMAQRGLVHGGAERQLLGAPHEEPDKPIPKAIEGLRLRQVAQELFPSDMAHEADMRRHGAHPLGLGHRCQIFPVPGIAQRAGE